MLLRFVSSFIFVHLLITANAGTLKPGDVNADGFLHSAYIVKFQGGLSGGYKANHTEWVRSLEHVDSDGTLLQGIRHEFSLAFDGYSAVFDNATVDLVRNTEGVAEVKAIGTSTPPRNFFTIEKDVSRPVSASRIVADDSGALSTLRTENDKGWNANRLSHRTFEPQSYANGPWLHDGYLGQGVTVYVLDTGVNLANPGFQGSEVVHGKNAVRGTQPSDLNGHGTMCAGVIAGNKHGLAPRARTVNVKVANDQDRSSCDDVVAGLEWVVAQPGDNNMKVISMSQTGFTGKPDVSTAVAAVVRRGVHVVVCAGNFDVDACGVQPGNAPGVVSVGSVEPNGKFPIKKVSPEGTNVGKCVTIFGPGSRVPTLSAKNISPNYKYFGWGTSIAAPQVAALIANRLSKVGPTSPANMIRWLQASATKGQIVGDLRGSPNLIAFSGVGEPEGGKGARSVSEASLDVSEDADAEQIEEDAATENDIEDESENDAERRPTGMKI